VILQRLALQQSGHKAISEMAIKHASPPSHSRRSENSPRKPNSPRSAPVRSRKLFVPVSLAASPHPRAPFLSASSACPPVAAWRVYICCKVLAPPCWYT